MKKNVVLVIALLPILFYACIHTQTSSPEATLLVSLKKMNIKCEATHPNIRIGAGSHQLISDCTYRLFFDKARGGAKFFLGKKIKESNPWTGDRMVLTIDDMEYRFSIEDIKKMPTLNMGDSVVYQLNIH